MAESPLPPDRRSPTFNGMPDRRQLDTIPPFSPFRRVRQRRERGRGLPIDPPERRERGAMARRQRHLAPSGDDGEPIPNRRHRPRRSAETSSDPTRATANMPSVPLPTRDAPERVSEEIFSPAPTPWGPAYWNTLEFWEFRRQKAMDLAQRVNVTMVAQDVVERERERHLARQADQEQAILERDALAQHGRWDERLDPVTFIRTIHFQVDERALDHSRHDVMRHVRRRLAEQMHEEVGRLVWVTDRPPGLSPFMEMALDWVPGDCITAEIANTEPNQEIRRLLIEKMGWARWFEESGAEVVQEDETGQLLAMGDATPWNGTKAVRVTNSSPEPDGTFKKYILRVPPHIGTALEGVAWTFGMAAADYKLTMET